MHQLLQVIKEDFIRTKGQVVADPDRLPGLYKLVFAIY